MAAIPLIIDTDPGKDDAVAILAALGARDLVDVLMLTTVGGNVPVSRCTANALQICALGGRPDIPVHEGVGKPLLRPANAVFHVHGDNGMGGVRLALPAGSAAEMHAVPALVAALRGASQPITIAALAPLTNIALALTIAPDIVSQIRDIVVMGGAFEGGNITPFASYNIHSDPHAARIVFDSGAPVTMIGLEITRQAVPEPEWLAAFASREMPVAQFCSALWQSPPLCFNDACAIGCVLDPGLAVYEAMRVGIETNDVVEIGQTVRVCGAPNVRVAVKFDRSRYFELLARVLK